LATNGVGTCSGFFISDSGLIVSCAHCVGTTSPSSTIFLDNIIPNGTNVFTAAVTKDGVSTIYDCELIGVDLRADIAVLRTKITLSGQPYLLWGDARATKIGDISYILGDPLAKDTQSISDGIFRDLRAVNYYPIVTIEGVLSSASSFGGNSGGPIVNKSGKVIGILSTGNDETLSAGISQYPSELIVNRILSSSTNYQDKVYFGIQTYPITSPFTITQLGLPLSFGLKGYVVSSLANNSLFLSGRIVDPFGTLASSGILVNDVIVAINGVEIGNEKTTFATPTWLSSPSTISVTYVRPPSDTEITIVVSIVTYATAFGLNENLTTDNTYYYV
jgi:S1-C subfamily serine protease